MVWNPLVGGALEGTFVEKNKKAETCLKSNLINVCKSAKIDENSAIIKIRDVIEFLKNDKKSYNLIFLDPPYHLFSKLSETIFQTIRENKILNKKGILIHEGSPEMLEKFDGWEITKKIGKKKRGHHNFVYLCLPISFTNIYKLYDLKQLRQLFLGANTLVPNEKKIEALVA